MKPPRRRPIDVYRVTGVMRVHVIAETDVQALEEATRIAEARLAAGTQGFEPIKYETLATLPDYLVEVEPAKRGAAG
jgi:hypothetical protein